LFTPLDEAEVDATAPDDALLVVNISLFFCLKKRESEREREISNYEERARPSLFFSSERERARTKRAKKSKNPPPRSSRVKKLLQKNMMTH